jgi:hypothetical protein
MGMTESGPSTDDTVRDSGLRIYRPNGFRPANRRALGFSPLAPSKRGRGALRAFDKAV